MGDPGAVQPVHVGPQPLEEVVADPLRGELAERAALYLVHGQQRGAAAGLDHPVDAGDENASPFGHHGDEGLCSTARMTEAAGQVSPTLRSRANRYAR